MTALATAREEPAVWGAASFRVTGAPALLIILVLLVLLIVGGVTLVRWLGRTGRSRDVTGL